MPFLLQYRMSLFAFDFAGSGVSGGEYVTLGYYEEDDIRVVIDYLVGVKEVSSIGLWGKSMGAVASILRASRDRRIDACVLDSPFANFRDVVVGVAAKSIALQWVPTTALDFCLEQVAADVKRKAGFDPRDLRPIDKVELCRCPAFFGSADKDGLVHTHQVAALQEGWGGLSEFMIFQGDHNSDRPKDFLAKASHFMWDALLAAADADERISGAVNAVFDGDNSAADRPRTRSDSLRPGAFTDSREDALLCVAVDSYVERQRGMDMAIDKFLRGGGQCEKPTGDSYALAMPIPLLSGHNADRCEKSASNVHVSAMPMPELSIHGLEENFSV